MTPRIADASAAVACVRQKCVDQPGKESVWPMRVHPVAGCVEFLHIAPDAPAVFEHGYFESRDPLIRNVGDVLDIVQERYRVVVAAKQQDLPVEFDEPLEH